jgi:hypothetical protein
MLNFENAQVLSLSQESQFLGSVFRYQIKRNLSVEGTLNNLTNTSGVSGLEELTSDFFNSDEDYQEIVINGKSFGRGRINNINTNAGNNVQLKTYSADITCYLSGDYDSLFGAYYQGLATSGVPTEDFSRLESISETFEYNRADSSFGYTHDVSLQFVSGFNAPHPIQSAKSLARVLIDSVVPFGFLISGDTSIGRKLYSESYDVITNECSFTENYERPINDSGIIYTITNSFTRDENGVSTVNENGVFQTYSGIDNNYQLNLTALAVETFVGSSYGRALDVFSSYSGTTDYPLYSGFVNKTRNINPFEGAGNYSISFTNDPRQISGVSWDYINELTKNGSFYTITENGNIIGHGLPFVGVENAKVFYTTVNDTSFDRINDFYSFQVDTVLPIRKTNETKTVSAFQGSVTYTLSYTDNPIYSTDNPFIKTEIINIEDSIPVRRTNKFDIFNIGEIVQDAKNSTMGARSVSVDLVGKLGTDLSVFKSHAKDKLNENIPSGSDVFLSSINYSYNPNEKNFSTTAQWNFFRDATLVV